jgi:hypothetical protein
MKSAKTGIVLLALVAISTASGIFLGWTPQPPAVPVESVMPAPEMPAVAPAILKAAGE